MQDQDDEMDCDDDVVDLFGRHVGELTRCDEDDLLVLGAEIVEAKENVVELYDYTESQNEFVLLMEYCNDAAYFEEKIEQVGYKFFESHNRG